MHTRVNVVRRPPPPPPQTVTFGLTPLGWKSPAPLTPALNHARADLERALLTFFFFLALIQSTRASPVPAGGGGGDPRPQPRSRCAVAARWLPAARRDTAPTYAGDPPTVHPGSRGVTPLSAWGGGDFLRRTVRVSHW